MKIVLSLLITFFALSAVASDSTEINCGMKRDEWEKMNFKIRFLTPKRALATFHYTKNETEGARNIPISAIHVSSEARYVGLNFLGDEKLVFILLTPIFAPENLGIPLDIEVVSSIYGPMNVKCRATK